MSQRPFDSSPRAVFFDLDDTLCDYASARRARLEIAFTRSVSGETIQRDGVDLAAMIAESIALHPHGADHFPRLFARFGIADPAEALASAAWYRENRFHGLALFPETRDVLQAVRDAVSVGLPTHSRSLAVITNGPAEVQRAKIDLLRIHELVDFALISEEFGAAKPDPSIFHEALRRAGVSARDVIFVGDSEEFDMVGARAAGLQSVWVNREGRLWTNQDWRPDREIASLRQLPALFAAGSTINALQAFG